MNILSYFLKLVAFVLGLFRKPKTIKVISYHPNDKYLMKKLYSEPKNPSRKMLLDIYADPSNKIWYEYIKLGPITLPNNYIFDFMSENIWMLKSTWSTITSPLLPAFDVDFSDPFQTVETFHDCKIDIFVLNDWIKFVKSRGVTQLSYDGKFV